MDKRQFHGIANLGNLFVQATDVLVAHIGDLLKGELGDLRLFHLFQRDSSLGINEHNFACCHAGFLAQCLR